MYAVHTFLYNTRVFLLLRNIQIVFYSMLTDGIFPEK